MLSIRSIACHAFMAAQQNFRSAFNGFNREDVVHYLEFINAKHTAQVNQLTAENEELREKLEAQPILEMHKVNYAQERMKRMKLQKMKEEFLKTQELMKKKK